MDGPLAYSACMLTAEEIQSRLSAHKRRQIQKYGYRHASVLLPLAIDEGRWNLVLTRRNSDLPHHQGQIAFPGGSMEKGESVEETALRESMEEIGLDPASVRLLGCHDDIWTPSGFIITPVIGIVPENVAYTLNPAEVVRLFHVPLCFFAVEENTDRQILYHEGLGREILFYYWGGERIWGATALIIRNLLELLSKKRDSA